MIIIGKYRYRIFFRLLFIAVLLGFWSGLVRPSHAIKVIRDAQLDTFMINISNSLFKAANLHAKDFDIYVYDSSSYNAFVSRNGMFISTSLLLESQTPNEVVGVIAHELGHLSAGHLALLKQRMLETNLDILSSFLLGFGAAAVIGLAGGGGGAASGVGLGVAALGTNVSNRNFFSFRQHQEGIADIIAFELLNKTGQSAKGLVKTFQFLQKKSNLIFKNSRYSYAKTHPATNTRIKNLQARQKKNSLHHKEDSSKIISDFNQLKAKIAGFSGEITYIEFLNDNKYQQQDKNFATAINLYTKSKLQDAMKITRNMLKNQPKNPFINEFYGQILLEAGNFSASLPYFEKAVQYAPKTAFNRIIYSKALLNSDKKEHLLKAVKQLTQANRINNRLSVTYSLLAQTYAKLGDEALAELFTAYAKFYQKKNSASRIHLQKANNLLVKTNRQKTRYFLLADDLAKRIQKK